MNQYLVSLLKEVNTIIIPGIGALTITNAATSEIMFLHYLKFDDGKLAQHISEKEGMDLNDAKNLVAKYVREIESQLNVGESYDMYKFGSFAKNSEGNIEFKPWNDEKESVSPEISIEPTTNLSETKPRTGTSDANEIIPKTIDDAPIVLAPEFDSERSSEVESIQITKKTQETKPDGELDTAASSIEFVSEEPLSPIPTEIPQQTILEPAYTEEQQWDDDLDLPPINTKIERTKKPIIEKVQPDKKRKSPTKSILIVVIILLIGGGTTVILMRDQLGITLPFLSAAKKSTDDKPKVLNEETEPEKSTKVESEIEGKAGIETPIETKDTEQSVSNSSDMQQTSTGLIDRNKPYHIVGAAFTELSNAERYQKKLTENGKASIIIGKFDQLYIVSISSHSSREEAKNILREAKAVSANAWIFKFP